MGTFDKIMALFKRSNTNTTIPWVSFQGPPQSCLVIGSDNREARNGVCENCPFWLFREVVWDCHHQMVMLQPKEHTESHHRTTHQPYDHRIFHPVNWFHELFSKLKEQRRYCFYGKWGSGLVGSFPAIFLLQYLKLKRYTAQPSYIVIGICIFFGIFFWLFKDWFSSFKAFSTFAS